MQILLIDDNEKLCLLYQNLLSRGGHETRIETKGEHALEAIRTARPDLILLDIMMEPVSGWEVLEQIRSNPDVADIPVIILTGKVLTALEAVKYGLKIEGFVMKPLERTMLLKVIDDISDVLSESMDRYTRAISAGMPPERAAECRDAVKKSNILQFLRENLAKQEELLREEAENNEEILHSLDEMREMIAAEYQKIHKIMEKCP
ncbi:response regulator [Methanospirillum sp.]|uniref:response regulator n=1 Tax=Methanospirillum sp. TaxID=45200 RepID=UPI002C3222BC|nr:response regulator [Methanospirillum sp.]HOL40906.1 response regulator [Methanospirillum sp.]HPP77264.1 response regulator [Methanospirillum sp.]